MGVIQPLQHIQKHAPCRRIVAHFDLLPDDALLLLHRLLREIRMLHKIQQNVQRRPHIPGTSKQIRRAVKAGECIGGRAGRGIPLERIAVLTFKQLVLQIMRDPRRHGGFLRVVADAEHIVDRSVAGGKHRVGRGVVRLGIHKNGQSGGMVDPHTALAGARIRKFLLVHAPSPPFSANRYTQRSVACCAAAITRSRVTAATASAASAGGVTCGSRLCPK